MGFDVTPTSGRDAAVTTLDPLNFFIVVTTTTLRRCGHLCIVRFMQCVQTAMQHIAPMHAVQASPTFFIVIM